MLKYGCLTLMSIVMIIVGGQIAFMKLYPMYHITDEARYEIKVTLKINDNIQIKKSVWAMRKEGEGLGLFSTDSGGTYVYFHSKTRGQSIEFPVDKTKSIFALMGQSLYNHSEATIPVFNSGWTNSLPWEPFLKDRPSYPSSNTSWEKSKSQIKWINNKIGQSKELQCDVTDSLGRYRPGQDCPYFVVIDRVVGPTSIKPLLMKDLVKGFDGIKLIMVEITITNDPVEISVFDRLPWLASTRKRLCEYSQNETDVVCNGFVRDEYQPTISSGLKK